MIYKTKFLAALMMVGFVASMANAGQVALSYAVTARFADDFTALPLVWAPGENIDDGPGIYQLDLFEQTTGLVAGERGFANLAFDTTFGAGLTSGADYSPDSSTVDSNGAAPGGVFPKWATNQDAGVAGDYDGILVSIVGGNLNADVDPRATLGDPSPEFFGSAFVKFDGSVGLHQFVINNLQYSLADLTGVFTSPQTAQDLSITFGAGGGGEVPVVTDFTDSADILNEVIATTLTATNSPTSWSNLLLPTYAPMFGALPGAPGLGIAPTWNPATQQFSFNTAGSTRGRYTWTVDATNATGTSTGEGRGLITVDVTQVPEPASIALFGVAMVGLVGIARRRG